MTSIICSDCEDLGDYCYLDLSVACEPIIYFPPEKRNALVNPRLLVEVTSPSSENEDRGSKFTDYRLIASLEEYVLASQTRYQVETFYKQPDGIWAFGPSAHGLDKSIKPRCLGFEAPLAEIYAGITLPSGQAKAEPTQKAVRTSASTEPSGSAAGVYFLRGSHSENPRVFLRRRFLSHLNGAIIATSPTVQTGQR